MVKQYTDQHDITLPSGSYFSMATQGTLSLPSRMKLKISHGELEKDF